MIMFTVMPGRSRELGLSISACTWKPLTLFFTVATGAMKEIVASSSEILQRFRAQLHVLVELELRTTSTWLMCVSTSSFERFAMVISVVPLFTLAAAMTTWPSMTGTREHGAVRRAR